MPAEIILNFLPIRKGGGLQNAMAFLNALAADKKQKARSIALVEETSGLEVACARAGVESISVKGGRRGRLVFEAGCCRRFRAGQICFTLFGPPMLGSRGHLVNVVGCAYSNLFYPEVPFWDFLPPHRRFMKECVDRVRRVLTAAADYWIFETDILRTRAVEICGFPNRRVGVVPMAASPLVSPERVDPVAQDRIGRRLPPGFRFLFLCGAHPNKRLHLLPQIAAELRGRGVAEFRFVTTMEAGSSYSRRIEADFTRLGVEQHWANIGPVPPDQVAALISCCDAMCSFSRLESFSNNFVEAWKMGVPLVAGDAEWCRVACGNAALYVEPTDPVTAAEQLARLARTAALRESITESGRLWLRRHPTPQQKLDRYFEEIEKAKLLGHVSPAERQQIRWPAARSM